MTIASKLTHDAHRVQSYLIANSKTRLIYLVLRLLNVRLVPVTFDVPRDVFTSPVSLESAIFPSKLVS